MLYEESGQEIEWGVGMANCSRGRREIGRGNATAVLSAVAAAAHESGVGKIKLGLRLVSVHVFIPQGCICGPNWTMGRAGNSNGAEIV